MEFVFYNGEFIKERDFSISINSRAFHYGDGFFETIKIINSKPFNFSFHIERIDCALNLLKLDSYTSSSLKDKILCLIKLNNLVNGIVKLHISRDSAGRYLPESNNCTLFIRAVKDSFYNKNHPVSLCFYEDEYKTSSSSSSLSNIKSISSLLYVLASIYANETGFDNSILFNDSAKIVETANANIFIVKDSKIYTPPLFDGCVDGTMRKWIGTQLDIIECSIIKDEILVSDEVFVTNASYGITSVRNIEETFFSSFKIADSLQNILISSSSGS